MDLDRKTGAKNIPAKPAATNFIRNIIADDLVRGTYEPRNWAGQPGVYDLQANGPQIPPRYERAFPLSPTATFILATPSRSA